MMRANQIQIGGYYWYSEEFRVWNVVYVEENVQGPDRWFEVFGPQCEVSTHWLEWEGSFEGPLDSPV